MPIRGCAAAAAVCACVFSMVYPQTVLAESTAGHQCGPSAARPSVVKKVVISRAGHPTHIGLAVDEGVRVVAHDNSAYGVRRPRLLSGSTSLCWLRRGGAAHRKWVLFAAVHQGSATIEWSPRVAPGTGTATEFVKVRVR